MTVATIPGGSARPRCVGRAALFFSDKERDVRHALELCRGCPARQSCGQDAVARGERFGIWGGMDEAEMRRAIRRAGPGRSHGT
jgi:WhiB family redox-sensing transcriptional regulator